MAQDSHKIKVSFNGDMTQAFIVVPYLTESGPLKKPYNLTDARNALKIAGVRHGIKTDVLDKIFSQGEFDKEVLIAEGRLPVHGEPGKLEIYFNHKRDFNPVEDKDGRVDYKDVNYLISVKKGDALCTIKQPTEGIPGETVSGKVLEAKQGGERTLPQGKNVEPDEKDPDTLVAAEDGCVNYNVAQNTIDVNPALEIKGDIDFNTGNIEFNGSLKVGGDIKSGFIVKTDGDLEVGGCIEDAEVDVGGDVMVKKGFIGRGKGHLKVAGDAVLKHAQGQNITCDGNLELGGELMHCNTKVGKSLAATSRAGGIIGGVTMVVGNVEASQLGSESYSHTDISVGVNFQLLDRIKEIEQEEENIRQNQEKVKKGMYNLARLRIKLKGNLPPEQEAMFDRLQDTSNYYPKQLETLKTEKDRIKKDIANAGVSYVKVLKTMHPGVKITIGKFSKVFKEQVDRKVIKEVRGEIVAQ